MRYGAAPRRWVSAAQGDDVGRGRSPPTRLLRDIHPGGETVPAERLPMRPVFEAFRIAHDQVLSRREIAPLGLSQSTISDYLRRFRGTGLPQPAPPAMDDAAVEARLCRIWSSADAACGSGGGSLDTTNTPHHMPARGWLAPSVDMVPSLTVATTQDHAGLQRDKRRTRRLTRASACGTLRRLRRFRAHCGGLGGPLCQDSCRITARVTSGSRRLMMGA
jgi:hypothetical protein